MTARVLAFGGRDGILKQTAGTDDPNTLSYRPVGGNKRSALRRFISTTPAEIAVETLPAFHTRTAQCAALIAPYWSLSLPYHSAACILAAFSLASSARARRYSTGMTLRNFGRNASQFSMICAARREPANRAWREIRR